MRVECTVRGSLNLSSLSDGFINFKAALGIHQMRGEDGVDERGFPKTSLAYYCTKVQLLTLLQV